MPAATASQDHPFGGSPGLGGEDEAGHAEETAAIAVAAAANSPAVSAERRRDPGARDRERGDGDARPVVELDVRVGGGSEAWSSASVTA